MPRLVITDREFLGMKRDQLVDKLKKAGFDFNKKIERIDEPFMDRITFKQKEPKK